VDRRQKLVDSARELIAERGFEGLRTRDVVDAVGSRA
jgi:AcrR family transcriptional regulator